MVSGAFTEHGTPRMVELMQLFRSDRADLIARPMSIFTITATGNFRYSEDSCQNLIDCVEAGIPVEIVPVTLMGLVAPVTTVGATVFHTVDVLAVKLAEMTKTCQGQAPVPWGRLLSNAEAMLPLFTEEKEEECEEPEPPPPRQRRSHPRSAATRW